MTKEIEIKKSISIFYVLKHSDGRQDASAIRESTLTAVRMLAPTGNNTLTVDRMLTPIGECTLTRDIMLAPTRNNTLTADRMLPQMETAL